MKGHEGPIPPGASIGVLGGGQLGLMLMGEAHRMGYRVLVLDPDEAAPARRGCDGFVHGAFDDPAAALRLAKKADVMTVETEHIPADPVLDAVAAETALVPSPLVLHTVQDRLRQKNFLAEHRIPQAPFRHVETPADLLAAVEALGAPLVLKSRLGGYDGKHQARIAGSSPDELEAAWTAVGHQPCIAEAHVDFAREVSVVLARGHNGHVRIYPVIENEHRDGILHTATAPAAITEAAASEATRLAVHVAERLGHVGAMAVEMFQLRDGHFLVNEIAPRVHNSGHLTLGAAATSQFENHLRAVLGLPLGDTRLLRPACMLNLLGDTWTNGTPDWTRVYERGGARLFLYGKDKVRPGRKMGHVLVTAPTASEARAIAGEIHEALHPAPAGARA